MQFTCAAFNYQSGDLEAEERNYLEHHVALAKSLPGIRLYYTGRNIEYRGRQPDHFRNAILAFDDAEASGEAFQTAAGPALITDSLEHLKDLRNIVFEGEVLVPFDARKPGEKCFIMTAEFNLDAADLAASENRYRNHHTSIARRLPGLRNYIIGKLGAGSDRYRIAILVFDSADSLKAAYHSPVGLELIKDEEATIREARVLRLDARVEV